MKKIYLLLILASIISSQLTAQTLQAVNDTIDLYPGVPKTVNLLANDTIPTGDSLKITSGIPGSTLITFTHNYKGFFTYLVKPIWGFNGNVSGTYSIQDYTINKTSSAAILFRIHDHSYDSLDINNVSAVITAYGNQFWLPASSNSFYQFRIPKYSPTSTIFNFTQWIAGKGADSTLYLAAERYRQGSNFGVAGTNPDYYAGPVMDSVNYSIYQDTLWNKVWKVKKSEIEYHKSHWNSPGYITPPNIISWPGNGNIAYGEAEQLAPYHDNNNDGKYNSLDGDYPVIMGDEAVYTIFNDDRGTHKDSGGKKMKLEFHLMAYAFDLPGDSAFKNTIFFNYKIINRSDRTYYNTYLGTFIDMDIGYLKDDYIMCDVERSSIIGYNGLPVDGTGQPSAYGAHPPAQSVTILSGPSMDPTGQDRPKTDLSGHQLCDESVNGTGFGDSIADNERYGLTNFMRLDNDNLYPFIEDPQTPLQYYRCMQSWLIDSTRLYYGGLGHAGYGGYGPDCRFMFPGESDSTNWGTGCQPPNGQVNWTEKTAGLPAYDIRGIGSMGPFTFKPGDVQELDIAFVFARDYTGQDTLEPSVAKLRQMIDIVKNSYTSGVLPDGGSFFGVNKLPGESSSGIKIWPNPATDRITIEIKSQNNTKNFLISIYDIQGQLVFEKSVSQKSMNINISSFISGVYIVKLSNNKGVEMSKFIKE